MVLAVRVSCLVLDHQDETVLIINELGEIEQEEPYRELRIKELNHKAKAIILDT